jgi:ApaG protein
MLVKFISFVQLQEGDFEMKHIDKAGSPTFNVAIAPFSLSILGDGSDAF